MIERLKNWFNGNVANARRAEGWLSPEDAGLLQVKLVALEALALRKDAELKAAKQPSFVTEYADEIPKWEPVFAEAWRIFLANNPAGQALQRQANFHEQQTNRAAVVRSMSGGADQNVGYARGWHDATEYFFKTLSATVPAATEDQATQPPHDAAALRERLAS